MNGETIDQALVEVALLTTRFVGARAVWETGTLRQVFVSRAQPVNIGLSAVIGVVHPVDPAYPGGASVTTAANGRKVMVPIAPGAVVPVGIGEIVEMEPGIDYPVDPLRPATLALDGEREITLNSGDEASVDTRPRRAVDRGCRADAVAGSSRRCFCGLTKRRQEHEFRT